MTLAKPRLLALLLMPIFMVSAVQSKDVNASYTSRVEEVLSRFTNANQHRNHVMVVAHRGSWWHNGRIILAENSLSAIERAISIGAEMVELDVRETKDGQLIILHDETLDRTTTCKGAVSEKTFSQLQACQLVIEGTNVVNNESIPSLKQALLAVKGRILVNVDLKMDLKALIRVLKIANEVNVGHQVVIKSPIESHEQLKAILTIKSTIDSLGLNYLFMPLVTEKSLLTKSLLADMYAQLSPHALESIGQYNFGAPLTNSGGPLFDFAAKALASKHDTHIWLDTIYYSEKKGLRSAGRGDEMAVLAGLPGEVWGFWAEQGVTIFQTDEPELAIEFLSSQGYRQPYADSE